jgi:hypothetical protein
MVACRSESVSLSGFRSTPKTRHCPIQTWKFTLFDNVFILRISFYNIDTIKDCITQHLLQLLKRSRRLTSDQEYYRKDLNKDRQSYELKFSDVKEIFPRYRYDVEKIYYNHYLAYFFCFWWWVKYNYKQ